MLCSTKQYTIYFTLNQEFSYLGSDAFWFKVGVMGYYAQIEKSRLVWGRVFGQLWMLTIGIILYHVLIVEVVHEDNTY